MKKLWASVIAKKALKEDFVNSLYALEEETKMIMVFVNVMVHTLVNIVNIQLVVVVEQNLMMELANVMMDMVVLNVWQLNVMVTENLREINASVTTDSVVINVSFLIAVEMEKKFQVSVSVSTDGMVRIVN